MVKKQCAHYRLIKTKKGRKKVLVNKGIRKKRNYGFMFKSTDWKGLAEEAKLKKDMDDITVNKEGKMEWTKGMRPQDTLKFIDWNTAFDEMRNKGVRISKEREQDVRKELRYGSRDKAYELLPSEGKMFASLARNAESVYRSQKEKKPRIGRVIRRR